GRQILAGEYGGDTGHLARGTGIDSLDPRMRVGRADDYAMQRIRLGQVGDIAPASPHEALVLQAVDAAAQQPICPVSLYGTRGSQRQPATKASSHGKSARFTPSLLRLFRRPHLVVHDELDVLRLDALAALVDQRHAQLLAVGARAQAEMRFALAKPSVAP